MEQSHDILDNTSANGENLVLSPNAIAFLKETRKWVNFLAILGFIGIGLMVLFGLFASSITGLMMSQMGTPPAAAGFSGMFGFMYVIISLIYFFPILYLYRFGAKLKVALSTNNNSELEAAFKNLKSHYKFAGVMAIIMIGFYAVGAIFFVIAGAGAAMMM